ncbi:uncharacterized protein N7458_011907 [Penicillium daleae]|uniref:Uncharacterized protein n=1 Tax=Penicillium daleae TaxID=63821 RepID=A0AAD6FWA5_9EURO|nr:uncharacterized protein N7458_011907 [Penicillium daleae]KAJ5432751.1 hypothetical protein N7458_011907 [Penicillium daleae]
MAIQYRAADTGSDSFFRRKILRSIQQQSSGQAKLCTFRVTRRAVASSDVRLQVEDQEILQTTPILRFFDLPILWGKERGSESCPNR